MPGTGRYLRRAQRLLATATRPTGGLRTRIAAVEFLLALALMLALPAIASAVSVT